MKIYILNVKDEFRPKEQKWRYPKHSKPYGVEDDFYLYLQKHPELLTTDSTLADWHYLPIYWTRWHVAHDYGKNGLEELKKGVDESILNDKKTFTICQYDDGPVVNIGNTIQFLASRKSSIGIDIPLLCSPHKSPFFKPKKKYLASFLGHANTHVMRKEMLVEIINSPEIFILDGSKGYQFFVEKTLESYITLAPRGYGGSSFRFFEAMQLGIVPFLIGDIDTRPFKESLPWNEISFYTNNPKEVKQILKSKNQKELIEMGKKAKKIYNDSLAYGKWCKYVIENLEK